MIWEKGSVALSVFHKDNCSFYWKKQKFPAEETFVLL